MDLMNSSLSLEQASLSFSLAQGPNACELFWSWLACVFAHGPSEHEKRKIRKGENLLGPDDWMVMLGIRWDTRWLIFIIDLWEYSWLRITRTLSNSNQNQFPLGFLHTFAVILPLVTLTVDNSKWYLFPLRSFPCNFTPCSSNHVLSA